jgi:hypothetical protein
MGDTIMPPLGTNITSPHPPVVPLHMTAVKATGCFRSKSVSGEAHRRRLLAKEIKLQNTNGLDILKRQEKQGWGAKVVDRLARDLQRGFPEIKGVSSSNLKYMRRFAEECPDCQIGQQPVDQLP